MQKRILTMIALWTLIGVIVGFGGLIGGKVLLLATATGVLLELVNILRKLKLQINLVAAVFALLVGLGGHLFGFASIGTSLALIITLLSHWKADGKTMASAILALIIVGGGFGSLAAIATRHNPFALWQTIWVIATIKLSDGGAYLIGTHFGARKFAPTISPGKTIEGLGGALLGGFILGLIGAPFFGSLIFSLTLGLSLSVVGCLGDLLESYLKRMANVKDSGHILPGIGGLLDLCDSILLAAPVAYWAITLGKF